MGISRMWLGWRASNVRPGCLVMRRGCGNSTSEASSANVFRYSVSTWALEEARRRLEAEGILPDPEKK
jgi:hypothetical protein